MSAADLLAALGKDTVTFQTFHDQKESRGKPTILHGTISQHKSSLQALNRYKQGIYFMVNNGDGKGRRTENVTGISSYFVDLDGTPLFDSWPLPPTAIVESSAGRYHVYWRVTGAPLDVFSHVQKHMATLLEGDDKVHDLPRVLRLPGFQHHKGEPFTSQLVTCEPANVFTHEQVLEAFAVPAPPPARKPLPPAVQALIDGGKKPTNGKGRDMDTAVNRVMSAQEGDRNHTLYRVASAVAVQVKNGELERSEAEERLRHAALAVGLTDHEATATIRSAMRHA